MRYLVIDGANVVINSVDWDGVPYDPGTSPAGWRIPDDCTAIASTEGDIGWTYDPENGTFIEPVFPIEVPSTVSSRQFKMQLAIAGLKAQVETWVAQQDELVQIAYAESGTFVRGEPMMQQGFVALGFTDQQIDDFFTAAAAL